MLYQEKIKLIPIIYFLISSLLRPGKFLRRRWRPCQEKGEARWGNDSTSDRWCGPASPSFSSGSWCRMGSRCRHGCRGEERRPRGTWYTMGSRALVYWHSCAYLERVASIRDIPWLEGHISMHFIACMSLPLYSPTSSASERVWSGFGHVIDKSATNIDYDAACRTMYLRYNHDSVDKVPLF